MRQCDVLVVGSGPAGSAAARAAAEAGVSVLFIEKNAGTGLRVRCGELVPTLLVQECPEVKSFMIQKVDGMVTWFPPDQRVRTRAPGLIIDRSAFDRHMADLAVQAGAELMVNARAVGLTDGCVEVRHHGEIFAVKPRVIIGADGPGSIVASWINARQTEFLLGMQVRVPLREPMHDVEIHFRPEFFGGYGWVFPRGPVANVGIGIRIQKSVGPRAPEHTTTTLKLESFVRRQVNLGCITEGTSNWQAGLIPAGGPGPTVAGNILLVGDAAGHTHPITGGGIAHAVLIGRLAGETAADTVKTGDVSRLARFESKWRRRWGKELARGVHRRKLLETHWDDLDRHLRSCWVVFPEYYR